jgi:hypothetical protein
MLTAMKRALRILALVLALATGIGWLATGSDRVWTQTSVPVKIVDDVTGIEGIQYRKQFVPGLDFLGAGLLISGFVLGASLFFRNSPTKPIKL